jgi:hypothetical protein
MRYGLTVDSKLAFWTKRMLVCTASVEFDDGSGEYRD